MLPKHALEKGKGSIEQARKTASRLDTAAPHGYDTHPQAPVAQLDRVSASEAEGRRFKSCRARQIVKKGPTRDRGPFFWVWLLSASSGFLGSADIAPHIRFEQRNNDAAAYHLKH